MSYDLAVFDLNAAPLERDPFLAWYREQTKWEVGRHYDDPSVCAPELVSWYKRMIEAFPAMNGPDAVAVADDPSVTDYSLRQSVIYAAFAWSMADKARELTLSAAAKSGVGVFEISSATGELWRPTSDGTLKASMHTGENRYPWFVVASLVRGRNP